MEELYWNRFAETGKITDYLNYRGVSICAQIMKRYERDADIESDYIDWDGHCIGADRRV